MNIIKQGVSCGKASFALVVMTFAVGSTAIAQPRGLEFYIISTGGGMITHLHACPDIACNTGDTCSCITASGQLKAHGAINDSKQYVRGNYTLEMSVDDSATLNNGATGTCFGSTASMVVTLPAGTLTLPFSGLACRIPKVQDQRTFGITAPAAIGEGTGKYVNSMGTGSFTGTFSPTGGNVFFNVVGFGQFE